MKFPKIICRHKWVKLGALLGGRELYGCEKCRKVMWKKAFEVY